MTVLRYFSLFVKFHLFPSFHLASLNVTPVINELKTLKIKPNYFFAKSSSVYTPQDGDVVRRSWK